MRFWWVATAVWLGACSDGPKVDLLLDLRTDLQPGVEFFEVRTERFDHIPRSEERAVGNSVRVLTAMSGDLFSQGRRIAVYSGLTPGDHVVRVRLTDPQGVAFLQRIVLVTVRRTSVFTVLMTRDCRGVTCPAAGDDPSAIACLGGRCVRPECTPETPEFCPTRTCDVGVTCIAAAACAEPQCSNEGTCLRVGRNESCPAGHWCNPELGCLPLPAPATDAGMTDASVDAGSQTDAGPPPVTATVQRYALSDIAGAPTNPRIAWTGTELGLVYVQVGPNVYFSRRDLSGARLGNVVLVSAREGTGNVPDITWNPDNREYALTWTTDAGNPSNTYFARYDPTGTQIGSDTLISSTGRGGSRFVRWNGSQYGVTYRDQDTLMVQRGYYVGVDATGGKIGNQVIVTGSGDCFCMVPLAWNGSRWGMAWADATGLRLGDDVNFGLFDISGTPDGPSVVPTDKPTEGDASDVRVVWAGDRFGIAWADFLSGTTTYFFTAVDSAATKLFPDVTVASGAGFGIDPWLEWDGSRFAMTFIDPATQELRIRWVDPDGMLLGDPITISDPAAAAFERPTMVWTGASYVAVWENASGGLMLGTITPE